MQVKLTLNKIFKQLGDGGRFAIEDYLSLPKLLRIVKFKYWIHRGTKFSHRLPIPFDDVLTRC